MKPTFRIRVAWSSPHGPKAQSFVDHDNTYYLEATPALVATDIAKITSWTEPQDTEAPLAPPGAAPPRDMAAMEILLTEGGSAKLASLTEKMSREPPGAALVFMDGSARLETHGWPSRSKIHTSLTLVDTLLTLAQTCLKVPGL